MEPENAPQKEKETHITNFWVPNRPNLSSNQQFRCVFDGIQFLQTTNWWVSHNFLVVYPIGFFRKSSSKTVPKTVEIKRSGEGKHPHLKPRNKRRGYVLLLVRFNDTMNMTNMMGISIEIVLFCYFEASSWISGESCNSWKRKSEMDMTSSDMWESSEDRVVWR